MAYARLLALALGVVVMAGCATTPKQTGGPGAVPEPAEGEAAVFGKVRLVEDVGVPMPAAEQDATVYLRPSAGGKLIRVSCSDTGEFGVYLPPGGYDVVEVGVAGYTFLPHVRLGVPEGAGAVYAGTLVLDGTPTGVEPGSGDSLFVYSVKDEFDLFIVPVRRASPGAEARITRAVMTPDGAVASGDYPNKVFRAKDVGNELSARTGVVEEVVAGTIVLLNYTINPVWLLTLPFQ